MFFHGLDADRRHILYLHAQHFTAFADHFPIALCRKFFILELLHEAGNFHV
jgi:hypothetical protein